MKILEEQITEHTPDLVGFTIPFHGNLFFLLRCAHFVKEYYPEIHVAFGGGYCKTELKSQSNLRIIDYVDFISLYDGAGPLLNILRYIEGEIELDALEQTFGLENDSVVCKNKMPNTIYHH